MTNESKIIKIAAFFALLVTVIYAQGEFKVGPVGSGSISGKAIILSNDSDIEIKGYITDSDEGGYIFHGWIIDSYSRKIVWNSYKTKKYHEEYNDVYKIYDKVRLKKGAYEIYYGGLRNANFSSVGNFFQELFGSGKRKFYKRNKDKLCLDIKYFSNDVKVENVSEVIKMITDKTFVSINKTGDDANIKKSFSLKKDTKVRVYAIGEGRSRESFDYAWIVDNNRHRKVWELNASRSTHAGGAGKNIKEDEEITLEAGNYTVNYVSDDSHSFEDWNEMPPYDPYLYGITIWPVNDKDYSNMTETSSTGTVTPFIEMIKVRSDELKSKGFRLKKDIVANIQCYGEEDYSGSMADYGWIINADNKETVWKMELENTEYAGGARKNRVSETQLKLKAGNYIVYYQTDDSHAYNDWNDNRPYEPERWGISLWTQNKEDYKYIESFSAENFTPENVIVEITKVRDDRTITKTFTLERETKIRILAIGEGSKYEMSDYAWIDNETNGKNVWEMTFRRTEHAGGASKNRITDEVIILPKGKYKVYYRTDDSHNYNDWNEAPPRNAESYGITIFYEK